MPEARVEDTEHGRVVRSDGWFVLNAREARWTTEPTFGPFVTFEGDTRFPELGINVVDLGLVYGVHLDDDTNAVIDMTLTSAACPLTDVIQDQTNTALEGLVGDVTINWVWMPPWGPDKITDDGREMLRALGYNV